MKQDFSIKDALKGSYAIIKPKFWGVIGQYLLIFFALSVMFSILLGRGALLSSVITSFLGIKWSLSYVKTGTFNFDNLFEDVTFKKFIYYIFTIILVVLSVVWFPLLILAVFGLATLIASISGHGIYFVTSLFIVMIALSLIPAVIFSLRLMFAKYLIIEKDIKPMQALKESKRITNGNLWKLFWWHLVVILLTILGVICLIVGLFFVAPLVAIATTLIYKKLLNEELESQDNPENEEVIVEIVEVEQI